MSALIRIAAGIIAATIAGAPCYAVETASYKYALAVEKAATKIADLLALKIVPPDALGESYEKIEDLKRCLSLESASTNLVFYDFGNKSNIALFTTRGEKSELRLNIGKTCADAVSLPSIAAVAMSYLAEAIEKRVGMTDVTKYIVPTDAMVPKDASDGKTGKTDYLLTYRTEFGKTSIKIDKARNTGSSEVVDQNGKTFYNEIYEFRN